MHYSCLVVASDVDKAREPFAEDRSVDPYRDYLPEDEIALMSEHYGIPRADLPALATKLQDWREQDGGIHEGRLFTWSTQNPQRKFDWYEAGGRFGPLLQLRESRLETWWFGLRRRRVTHVTRARKRDILPEPLLASPPVAILHQGLWREAPCSIMADPGPEWIEEFAEAFAQVADDEMLHAMDLHA